MGESSVAGSTLQCALIVDLDDECLEEMPVPVGVRHTIGALSYAGASSPVLPQAFDNIGENPRRQSVMGSAAMHTNPLSMSQQSPHSRWTRVEELGVPGNSRSRPMAFDDDTDSAHERVGMIWLDEFQVDIYRNAISERLCADFVEAQDQLAKLECGSRLTVDLSPEVAKPLENRFWDTFEAVLKEERTKSNDSCASDHLEYLKLRRDAKYGLTKKMLEDVVTPMLDEVQSFAPYSKLNFESNFRAAALPSWHVWEALAGMDPPLTPEYVAENLDESLRQLR